MSKSPIRRREFVAAGTAMLTACSPADTPYFGNIELPPSSTLVHSLLAEPATLDPAKAPAGTESYVVPALFEGLTVNHPFRPEPMAGLATHYEVSAEWDRFTFYLRGHAEPRGTKLPDTNSLPVEFTGGQKAAPASKPAYWSDGRLITAHDFVYSWRRLLRPETAAMMAFRLYCIVNAEEINTGKRSPESLGVKAIDDFTLQIDLCLPTPFLLGLISYYPFCAVPRQAIEAARQRGDEASWTEPRNIVVSGPFKLRQWRPYDVIIATRNPHYFEAHVVGLDELVFPIIVDGYTTVSLYKHGKVAAMPGPGFPPLFTPVLRHKKDFRNDPAFATVFPTLNVSKPPFDNALLRYSLNMATDKQAITDFLGAGRVPASSLVPPMPAYPAPDKLYVEVDGRKFDVLSFDIEAARALMRKAGFASIAGSRDRVLELKCHFPILPDTKPISEILQQQWALSLGVRTNIEVREFNVHWQMVGDREYSGVAAYAWFGEYYDPNVFLEPFSTMSSANPSGWSDPVYRSMLEDANRTLNPQSRMTKLADCERRLLTAMPFLPLYQDVWAYLQKPFVKGLRGNPLIDIRCFKYARLDSNWRAA